MRAPRRVTRQDGGCVSIHNPSIYLSLLVCTAASRTCLAPHRPAGRQTADEEESNLSPKENGEEEIASNVCQRVGPNIHVAMAAAHFKMNYGHHARKKEIRLL